MSARLAREDLPEGWFDRNREQIQVVLEEDLRLQFFSKRLGVLRYSVFKDHYIPRLNTELLSAPLHIGYALKFYNNPAIFYMVASPRPWETRDGVIVPLDFGYNINSWTWLEEAFSVWGDGRKVETGFSCKDPFTPIYVDTVEFTHFGDWIGLAQLDSPHSTSATGGHSDSAVAATIRQHGQLCDLVHDRARRPLNPHEEQYVSDWEWYQRRVTLPLLSPVCRAVLIIGREKMQEHRRVLVVLTGDNASMLSAAPTFDSIPRAEIVAYRSDKMVEVSLKTAVEYLRHLDEEEEKVNDVLRRTTERRRQILSEHIPDEAKSQLDEWS